MNLLRSHPTHPTKLQSRREHAREETDRKIMQATVDIATTLGVGAVSIEEVARRSGVAKTTIYRRYRNTEEMLKHLAIPDAPVEAECEDLEPSRDNLQCALEYMLRRFTSDIGLDAVAVAITSGNEYFNRIVKQHVVPAQRFFTDFIDRGARAGVFRTGLDTAFLFSTVIGSMVAQQALRQSVADAGSEKTPWPQAMADVLWPSITPSQQQ